MRVHPQGQPVAQHVAVHCQADLHGRLEVLPPGHKGAEGPAGELVHFQGPDDPPGIVEPSGGHRVHLPEPCQQGCRAVCRELGLQLPRGVRVGAREFQHVEGRPHVEARAAGQDGPLAAGVDVRR